VLRGVFGAGPLRKPVWTFAFDRRTPVTAELLEKARTAVTERAVMASYAVRSTRSLPILW